MVRTVSFHPQSNSKVSTTFQEIRFACVGNLLIFLIGEIRKKSSSWWNVLSSYPSQSIGISCNSKILDKASLWDLMARTATIMPFVLLYYLRNWNFYFVLLFENSEYRYKCFKFLFDAKTIRIR